MFKVENYLKLVKDVKEDSELIIEDCGKVCNSLTGIFVVLEEDKLEDLLSYVEVDLQNPTYVYNMLQKNPQKGMNCLLRMLHLNSYTVEFIKLFGDVQLILDMFNVDSKASEEEENAPNLNFAAATAIVDNADNTVSGATDTFSNIMTPPIVNEDKSEVEKYTDIISEENGNRVYDESTPSTFSSNNIFTETEEASDVSKYSDVQENPDENTTNLTGGEITDNSSGSVEEEPVNMLPVIPAEFNEMLLMLRAMSAKMGIIDMNNDDVMNEDDIHKAKMYINAASATTVRDGVIAVLDSAMTKEELRAITIFMSKFISFMREV